MTLFAYDSGSESSAEIHVKPQPSSPKPAPIPAPKFTIDLLSDTQGGSHETSQTHLALHPMRNISSHQKSAGVDGVMALGD
jgi:hypothetical protein